MRDFFDDLSTLGGFWHYEDGKKYLAKLTSGKVSDTFVNCSPLTSCPTVLKDHVNIMVGQYLKKFVFHKEGGDYSIPTHICGPAMGGITLSYEVARVFSKAIPDHGFKSIFTESTSTKEIMDGTYLKKSRQELKRFDIPDNAKVLMVEDVITTGKSTTQMIQALFDAGAMKRFDVLPYVMCMVNRSDMGNVSVNSPVIGSASLDFQILPLTSIQARTWETLEHAQKDCPSVVEALRPKANWDKLVEG